MRYFAMCMDALLIWACAAGAYVWRLDLSLPSRQSDPLPPVYNQIVLLATVFLIIFFDGMYRSWRLNDLFAMLRSVAVSWFAAVMLTLVWLFLAKSSADVSRIWFLAWAISTMAALCLARTLIHLGLRWLRLAGYNFRTVILVGSEAIVEQARQAITRSAWSGLRIQAVLAVDDLATYLATPAHPHPDEVWLCLTLGDKTGIQTALHSLRCSAANIRLVPDWFSLKLINHGVSEVLGLPMLDLSASPMTGSARVVKWIEDQFGALLIVVLISPLLLVIALAVKLTSPGPVLFIQLRRGWNEENIWIYKFRTMVMHHEPDHVVTQAVPGDQRVTPLGAFLRRTSLDELPQFINVLQGRMSIVGPRPHALEHDDHYKELLAGYMLRHKVKPGITGWAQINGFRGQTESLEKMKKRIEYDLYYVEHFSLWLDLKIIIMTVFKGWTNPNAY